MNINNINSETPYLKETPEIQPFQRGAVLNGRNIVIFAVGGPNDPSGGVSQVYARIAEQLIKEGASVSILVKDWDHPGEFIYHRNIFEYDSNKEKREVLHNLKEVSELLNVNKVDVLQIHSWRVVEDAAGTKQETKSLIETFRDTTRDGVVQYIEHLPVEPGIQGSREYIRTRLIESKHFVTEEDLHDPKKFRDLVLQMAKKEFVLNELAKRTLATSDDSKAIKQAKMREKNPILERKGKDLFRMACVLNALERLSLDAENEKTIISFVSKGQMEELCKAFGINEKNVSHQIGNFWEKKCLEMKQNLENLPFFTKERINDMNIFSEEELKSKDIENLKEEARIKIHQQMNLYAKLSALANSSWQNIAAEYFSVIENATDMVNYDTNEIHVQGERLAHELKDDIRKKYHYSPNQDISLITSVGRVGDEKGSFELAEGIRKLIEENSLKNKKICLRYIGMSSPEIKEQIHRLLGNCNELGVYKPLEEQIPVIFVDPIVNRKTLAEHISATDVFAVPSKADSFGLAFIEAMALKKPVIAPMIPAVKQLFVDSNCAIGVNVTGEGVKEGLEKLYRMSPKQIENLTTHARKMVEQRWKIDKMTDNHLNAIAQIIASH